MGTTRIDDLPERRLIRSIADARQVSKEQKGSPQRVSGGNLAFITSESAERFDWSGVLDGAVASPAYRQARFVITLTASRAIVPLLDIAATVNYSSDGGATWNEYSYERGLSDSYTASGPEIYRTMSLLPGIENDSGEVRYGFQLFGLSGTHVAFKLQIQGTDEVTINVVRTV